MKFIFTISLIALTLLPPTSFAAKRKGSKKTTAVVTPPPVTAPTNAQPISTRPNSAAMPEISADVGLGTAIQKFHFGLGFKVQFPVVLQSNNFKFGGRTGFYIGPSSPSTWIFPLMATGELEVRTTSPFKPYVGVELGISIAHFSSGVSGISGSSTDFGLLFVPGVNFGELHQYFFEIPIGTLNQNFVFLPSLGMHI